MGHVMLLLWQLSGEKQSLNFLVRDTASLDETGNFTLRKSHKSLMLH
jgi:hypothetical protein